MNTSKSKAMSATMSKVRIRSFYCAALMVAFALVGLFTQGLNLGLDFTGGYLTEFSTNKTLPQQQMSQKLTPFLNDGFQLTSAENGTYWTVRTADNGSNANAWLSEFSQSINAIQMMLKLQTLNQRTLTALIKL